MSEVRYIDLKKMVREKPGFENYQKLLSFVKEKLDLQVETIKYNEVLLRKSGEKLTLEELQKMVMEHIN